jgi:hypothetical protein
MRQKKGPVLDQKDRPGLSDHADDADLSPRNNENAKPAQAVTGLDVFTARCDARAILYRACVYDLHEAVDVLQAGAERTGPVGEISQDAVQKIMAQAFHAVRPRPPDKVPALMHARASKRRRLPISTLRAAEYLIQQRDRQRLRSCLAVHSRDERVALQKYFNRKKPDRRCA